MTREQKLRYHLEMVIWQELPDGTTLNAEQIERRINDASTLQHSRAYQRALVHSPLLLPNEREPCH